MCFKILNGPNAFEINLLEISGHIRSLSGVGRNLRRTAGFRRMWVV
jgi:hypothetical protein